MVEEVEAADVETRRLDIFGVEGDKEDVLGNKTRGGWTCCVGQG